MGQSILVLAVSDYNLSAKAKTFDLRAALDLSLEWKHGEEHICTAPSSFMQFFFPIAA